MAVTLTVTQSGSGSTKIHAQSGDTLTIAAASVVHNSQLAAANTAMQQLSSITGVKFTIDPTGSAS